MKNYVVGTDAVLAKVDSPLLDGWITVGSVKELQTYTDKQIDRAQYPGLKWKGTKFPAALMQQVIGTIHEFPRMETAYSLYYNVTTGEWAVKCPDQNGSGASVSYADDGTGMPEGFSIIGSIHTHPEMGAFWSGTDLNDQQKKHGIHFVFGLRNGLVATSKVSVFTPNEQFDQNLHDVVEDFDWAQVYPAVPEWVETIKAQRYVKPVTTYRYYGNYKYTGGKHNTKWDGKRYSGNYDYNRENYGSSYGYGGWYGGYYGGWEDWDSDYEDPYDDYPTKKDTKLLTGSTTSVAGSTTPKPSYWDDDDDADLTNNKYITVFDEMLGHPGKGEEFRKAILETQTRANISYVLDLTIIDTTDVTDVLEGIEEIMTIVPTLDRTTEDEKTILETVMDAMPEVNLIEPTDPAFRNGHNMDAITGLINGMIDSYCENPNCLDATDVSTMLSTLKDAYETMLRVAAEKDAEDLLPKNAEQEAYYTVPDSDKGAEEC